MELNEFAQFAFYFSVIQILGQVFSMQLGPMFFRKGIVPKNQPILRSALKSFNLYILIAGVLALTFIQSNESIATYIFVSIIAAFYIITHEYARAELNERQAYTVSLFFSAQYLLVAAISKNFEYTPTFQQIATLDVIWHLVTIFIYGKILNTNNFKILKSKQITIIYILWHRVSRQLIINTLAWYLIFNIPTIIGRYTINNDQEYTELSITMRIMVALSTLSSTICLSFQKNISLIYTNDRNKYEKYKAIIIFKLPAALFIISLVFFIIFNNLLDHNSSKTILILKNNLIELVASGYLFTILYSLSIVLIAEEKFKEIHVSMTIGVAIYISTFLIAIITKFNFLEATLLTTLITMSTVYTIRLRSLTRA